MVTMREREYCEKQILTMKHYSYFLVHNALEMKILNFKNLSFMHLYLK